jgi:hypothetical protein
VRLLLRLALDTLAISSLLACAGLVVLWVRSHQPHETLKDRDNLTIRAHDPRYWLISEKGRVIFCRQVGRNWDHPLRKFELAGIRFGGLWGERSMLWNLEVPYGFLVAAACALPLARLWAWRRRRRDRRRLRKGLCRRCGYDLRGNASGVCPECGSAITLKPSHVIA